MKMSFAPIVKRAAPAVVNVYSTRVVRRSGSCSAAWACRRTGWRARLDPA
jgi:S1-C subfamily serine protease